MTRHRSSDRGTAGVEVALSVTALLMVSFFVVGALRLTNTAGDVTAAARVGARAAAVSRSTTDGDAAVRSIVVAALGTRGVACLEGPQVTVDRTVQALATVTVTCVVGLDDVAPAGFHNSRVVTASASERTDEIRGGA